MTAPNSANPVTVWADEAGPVDAPLVVLIHGSMDRSSGMLKLSRALDGHCRVARYDRRGYGRSLANPGPFGMDEQVADLVGVIGGRRAILVGHSYGGNVALATAERHPDLVRGIGIYETPVSWLPWWPGTTAGSMAVAARRTPEEAAERFMRRMVGDERWEALPERTRQTRRHEGVAMVGELSDLHANPPWSPESVLVPLIVGMGSLGAAHHGQGARWIVDHVPGARLVTLDGCRHDAPLSHPVLFAREIVEPLVVATEGSAFREPSSPA
jgi:pimeloyl-ACP methyl ester carboxylesterase